MNPGVESSVSFTARSKKQHNEAISLVYVFILVYTNWKVRSTFKLHFSNRNIFLSQVWGIPLSISDPEICKGLRAPVQYILICPIALKSPLFAALPAHS